MLTVVVIGRLRPDFCLRRRAIVEGAACGLRDIWAMLLLFVFVIGGLYGGLFTPTEAGGMGATGALLIGVARGRLTRPEIRRSLLQAVRTAAAVLTVLIGALLFGYFLTVTQTPQNVTAFLTGARSRPLRRARAHHADVPRARLPDGFLAMIILTIPIIFPVIPATRLRSDLVRRDHCHDRRTRTHSSAGRDERVRDQKRGAGGDFFDDLPRRAAVYCHRPFRLVILIAFPILALWLPSHM